MEERQLLQKSCSEKIFATYLNGIEIELGDPKNNYLGSFHNTYLNCSSLCSCLVSQSKSKITNNDIEFSSMDLLPIAFNITLL